MLTMTRQHLYAAILRAARREGVDIVTNSEVAGALPNGVLLTADGKQYQADLVIGADGVKSKVRDSIGLLKERNAYGDGIIRVLVPRMKKELGPGTWDHVIDFWNLERRSLRILYVPCNREDLYLAMMAPVNDPEASSIPVRQDIWIDSFPQLEPVLRKVTVGGRYDAYETSKLIRWSSGRVAIIGDAAHAMTPTLGQGAGTAMMNALALSALVTEAAEVETALQDWEDRERPLTERTQDLSAQIAKERAMSRGEAWNDQTLQAARHIPTGTAHLPDLLTVPA
jgi:2-methyl-3-hydroxypyridine 5-carboxylic acid dioxygenase